MSNEWHAAEPARVHGSFGHLYSCVVSNGDAEGFSMDVTRRTAAAAKAEATRRAEYLNRHQALLKEAHDLMDDTNANGADYGLGCAWCRATGYDGDGLKHDATCILVRIRQTGVTA